MSWPQDWARWLLAWVMHRLSSNQHGRHTDWDPCICQCGWMGPMRWLVHGYQDDGSGEDVEPMDYCPRCGQEDLHIRF